LPECRNKRASVPALNLSRRDRNRAGLSSDKERRRGDALFLIHKVLTGAQRRILILFLPQQEVRNPVWVSVSESFSALPSSLFSLYPSRVRRFRRLAALARFDSDQQPFVEAIHRIDVTLGARIVSHHHDRFLELAIHIDQQAQNFLG